jgi:nicotinate-nucleotide adenylyltransferase
VRVLVLGGSFDPVHRGHLRLAEEGRRALGAERVLLVPAAAQPLKTGGPLAPAADRLAMLRIAAQGRPWLEVSDVDLRRPGPSYTVETLEALRAELGPGARLIFLAGADVLPDLARWYRIDDILSLAEFVIATRPGYRVEPPPALRGRVRTIEIDALPISATDVRARLAANERADDLLPEGVGAYIREHGLYKAAATP